MTDCVKIRVDALLFISAALVSLLVFAIQIQFSQTNNLILEIKASITKLEERIHYLETNLIPREIILNHEKILKHK